MQLQTLTMKSIGSIGTANIKYMFLFLCSMFYELQHNILKPMSILFRRTPTNATLRM